MKQISMDTQGLTPFVGLLATGVAFGALGALPTGCSSEPGEYPNPGTEASEAPVATVEAQPATKASLGVAAWQFFVVGNTIDHVDGVDDKGDFVVSIKLSAAMEKRTIDGIETEQRVVTIETSSGGLLRVGEDGTVLDSSPDPEVFRALAQDIEPLIKAHPELKEYDCSWLGTAICYATCAACAFDPPACIMCGLCVVDCFF